MVKRIGGSRRKSRNLFKKHARDKGKVPLSKYFQEFKEGDKVLLHMEPAVQKATYPSKFHSKVGIIGKKRGRCYELTIQDSNKEKLLVLHPIHLRKIE
ncbi:50S ribosomal protein L21e [archaeon]|nr:50S ribosomal protein L21e [archaeon]